MSKRKLSFLDQWLNKKPTKVEAVGPPVFTSVEQGNSILPPSSGVNLIGDSSPSSFISERNPAAQIESLADKNVELDSLKPSHEEPKKNETPQEPVADASRTSAPLMKHGIAVLPGEIVPTTSKKETPITILEAFLPKTWNSTQATSGRIYKFQQT
ncbi:unnamed protein product [Orchesella dallaii]|uniref:Uncharacterized protein n=1 Tax=Orchesella dallaii TaxID=48710 RepID=A0ABP1RKD9_9HEXA